MISHHLYFVMFALTVMHEKILREAGLKITLPRLKILELLHHPERRHWNAEALHQALVEQKEEVGLATVYRVLTQFEMMGIVKKHFFEDDIGVFELNEGEHHDHLVCLECGRVEEFVDETIEKHQLNIAERFRFKLVDHRLMMYGLCRDCQ